MLIIILIGALLIWWTVWSIRMLVRGGFWIVAGAISILGEVWVVQFLMNLQITA